MTTAVKEYKAGKVEFRVDSGGNVHCIVGKMSFDEAQLVGNIEALLKHVQSLRPSAAKGTYIRNITIAATMTPGISVALWKIRIGKMFAPHLQLLIVH